MWNKISSKLFQRLIACSSWISSYTFNVAEIITQRRSIAKSWVFSAASVYLFVCRRDDFRMSKHRMMKLGGTCVVQKSWPSSNLGVIAHGVCTPKNVALGYDVGKISAGCLVLKQFQNSVSSWNNFVSVSDVVTCEIKHWNNFEIILV